MILIGVVLLLIPFETHPVLSRVVAGLTPIKWIGFLAVVKAIALPSAARPIGLLSTRQGRIFLALIGWSMMSWVIRPDWGSVPLQTQASFLLLYVLILRSIDSVYRARAVCAILLLAMAISSLYILREYFLFAGTLGSRFRPWGGTFADPNYFALSAVMVLPYAWANWRLSESRLTKLVYQVLGSLVFTAIMVSLSRGALVALLGMIGSLLVLSSSRKKAFLVALAMLVALGALMPGRMWTRLQNTRVILDEATRGDVASTTRRWHLYVAGLRMVREHPITGVGLGAYKPLSTAYEPELDKPGIAHSTYLELAAEQGMAALLLFGAMVVHVFRNLLSVVRTEPEDNPYHTIAKALIYSHAGFYVGAMFLTAWNTKVYWVSMFVALCLIQARAGERHAES